MDAAQLGSTAQALGDSIFTAHSQYEENEDSIVEEDTMSKAAMKPQATVTPPRTCGKMPYRAGKTFRKSVPPPPPRMHSVSEDSDSDEDSEDMEAKRLASEQRAEQRMKMIHQAKKKFERREEQWEKNYEKQMAKFFDATRISKNAHAKKAIFQVMEVHGDDCITSLPYMTLAIENYLAGTKRCSSRKKE